MFIGIDYGRARIGVASAPAGLKVAMPLKCLKHPGSIEGAAKTIAEEIKRHRNVNGVVFGLPLHLDGNESEMSQEVRKVAKHVEDEINAPVHFFDERMTSSAVDATLREQNISRKKRKESIDAMAAAMLLQNFLDSNTP